MTPEIALTAARNTGKPVAIVLGNGRLIHGVVERITLDGTFRANGRDYSTNAVVEVSPA